MNRFRESRQMKRSVSNKNAMYREEEKYITSYLGPRWYLPFEHLDFGC